MKKVESFNILAPRHPQKESFRPWKSISLKDIIYIIIYISEIKLISFESFNILASCHPQ